MKGKSLFKFGETRSLFRTDSDSESSDSDSSSEEESNEYISLGCTDNDNPNGDIIVASNNGAVIKLHQNYLKGIAHHIWPAAIHLCKYLEDHIDDLEKSFTDNSECNIDVHFNNTPIIELGAGIGLCGIFCSKILHSPQVHITDLDEAMPIINENIELNNGLFPSNELGLGTVRAVPLDWFDRSAVKSILNYISSPSIDNDTPNGSNAHETSPKKPIVIAADCVYFEHLFEPLYRTLDEFVTLGCVVIMCHVRRWKRDNKFFAMCRRTMKCEVLNEDIQYLPDDNTGILRKTITRMYKFS